MERPPHTTEEDIYPEPSEQLLEAQLILSRLKELGADCRQRKFSHPGEIIDYVEWAPYIHRDIPPVAVSVHGGETQVPDLISFHGDDDPLRGIGTRGIKKLGLLENITGTTLSTDARCTEEHNPETMQTEFSAEIVCNIFVHDAAVELGNGLRVTPQRQAIVPLHENTQIEIVELKQLENKRQARHQLLQYLAKNHDQETTEDINLAAIVLSAVNEEVETASAMTWKELSSTSMLKEISAQIDRMVSDDKPKIMRQLTMDFYRTHLPLIDRQVQLISDGTFIGRTMINEGEEKESLFYPQKGPSQFLITGKVLDVLHVNTSDQVISSLCFVVEVSNETDERPRHLWVPIRNILEIRV